ncbi:hypothetical protein COY32_02170 [candidate division WWE3 bacterium CG_4_10_14_0_2_um_filter_41_14]|uniref:Uncharacterized protein n=1 Tax=candidate division WWE3 bacterium CG_4_10_14_0_2_um_filter_41_14 TaxID=1975072 RepID=A0A2M7TK51_UNCKA|nr:MAG: hypothetical protein COY32_02170 [candidate division WWE3 bacterium CG_4_10_14_0_2_um_filter_41_14]
MTPKAPHPNLFRGSPFIIEQFEPELVHESDVKKLVQVGIYDKAVVWASPFKNNALAFAALTNNNLTWMLHTWDEHEPATGIEIITSGGLDKLDVEKIVYLYRLPHEDFIQISHREFVCPHGVTPIKREAWKTKDILKLFNIQETNLSYSYPK